MKVLHILDTLNRGGSEMLTLDVYRNCGNTFDLILVSFSKGDLYNDFASSGSNYFLIERKKKLDLNVIIKLRKLLKNKNIDIIHTHQAFTGLYAAIASLGLRKIKLVRTFHGYQKKQLFTNFLSKILIPIFDLNISVSYGFIEVLKKESIFTNKMLKKFQVVYNGIDTNKLIKFNGDLKKELNIGKDSILVGMVGNFVPWKDQLTVCRAAKKILEKDYNLYFCFVGAKSPEYKINYDSAYLYCEQNNLLNNVFFLGKRSDINNILNSLDIFVFSSIEDTFAISLVEAMLFDLPTIASDILPIREITENGKYSILFNTGDSDDLTNKMVNLLRVGIEEYIKNIKPRKYVEKRFSISNHINTLNKYYNKII